jgi:hypothetical protein
MQLKVGAVSSGEVDGSKSEIEIKLDRGHADHHSRRLYRLFNTVYLWGVCWRGAKTDCGVCEVDRGMWQKDKRQNRP